MEASSCVLFTAWQARGHSTWGVGGGGRSLWALQASLVRVPFELRGGSQSSVRAGTLAPGSPGHSTQQALHKCSLLGDGWPSLLPGTMV